MEFGLKNIIFILVFLAGAAFFSKNVLKLISYLKLARPDNRFGEVGNRIVIKEKIGPK